MDSDIQLLAGNTDKTRVVREIGDALFVELNRLEMKTYDGKVACSITLDENHKQVRVMSGAIVHNMDGHETERIRNERWNSCYPVPEPPDLDIILKIKVPSKFVTMYV